MKLKKIIKLLILYFNYRSLDPEKYYDLELIKIGALFFLTAIIRE
jgi:hypothetical protein